MPVKDAGSQNNSAAFERRKARFLVPLALIALGAALGFLIRGVWDKLSIGAVQPAIHEFREGGGRLTNPLLECDGSSLLLSNPELHPFKNKIDVFIGSKLNKNWASNVSVYFRELNDGLQFSIGHLDEYTPGSLRKLPLLIAILKAVERDKDLLSRKLVFRLSRDYNIDQNIKPSQHLSPGQEYTVEELLRRSIVYSDNNAFMLLNGIVNPAELDKVYSLLSEDGAGRGVERHMTVRTYASFLRILYNASYLSRESSEQALDYLTQSEFRSGIVAGVPGGIMVAHKFGEKYVSNDHNAWQLHDCGIVYYPRHPYLLCVMTRGSSFEYLDDSIAAISGIVYRMVDEQHGQHLQK